MKTHKTFLACKAKGSWRVAGEASQAGALLGAGRGTARLPSLCVCCRPGHHGTESPAGPAHPLGAVFDSSAHTPSAVLRPALSVAAPVQEAPWRFASTGRSAPKLPGAAAASSAADLFFEFFLQCLCLCPLPFVNAVTSGKLFNLLNLGFHVPRKG